MPVAQAQGRHQLAGRRAHRFGASSGTSEQLQLALESASSSAMGPRTMAREIAIAAMTVRLRLPEDTPANKPERKLVPDHIPQTEVELTPGSAECAQCGGKPSCKP